MIRKYIVHIAVAGAAMLAAGAAISVQSAHADAGDPPGPFATALGAGCQSGAGFRASQFAGIGGGHIKVTIDGDRVLDADFADAGTWRFDPPPADGRTRRGYRADVTGPGGFYSLQQNWVGPCGTAATTPPPPLVIVPNDPPTDAAVHPATTVATPAPTPAIVAVDAAPAAVEPAAPSVEAPAAAAEPAAKVVRQPTAPAQPSLRPASAPAVVGSGPVELVQHVAELLLRFGPR